ncbi:MAG: CsbD family protein [Comamonadaceae bacterium]|nr:MAG: CsbD family protein [Comamonadaceae bacterium]
MNKDQVKGVGKQIAGEVQEQVGKLTGDTSTRVKGHAKEAEGKLQKGYGDAKEAVNHSARELEAERQRKLDLER